MSDNYVQASQDLLQAVVADSASGAFASQSVLQALVGQSYAGSSTSQVFLQALVAPALPYSPHRRPDETWFRP